jgi:hypothetical protein
MLRHIADKTYGYNVIDIYEYFSRCQVVSNMGKFHDILWVVSYISFEGVENVKSTSIIIPST